MKWLLKLFDNLYRNLTKFLAGLLFFFIIVMVIVLSAQYIGEVLGEKILINKNVSYLLCFDHNKKETKKLFYKIEKNDFFKNTNIRFIKADKKDCSSIKTNKFQVIVADSKDAIKEFIESKNISAFPYQTIPYQSKKYTKLSKYGEYIKAKTTDGIFIYIATMGNLSSFDESKVVSSLSLFNDVIFRKISQDPYYEEVFGDDGVKDDE